jgi:hypothetical protein
MSFGAKDRRDPNEPETPGASFRLSRHRLFIPLLKIGKAGAERLPDRRNTAKSTMQRRLQLGARTWLMQKACSSSRKITYPKSYQAQI